MYSCVLPTESFSRVFVPPPTDGSGPTDLRRYYAVVPIAHVPEDWTNWTEVNAREATDKGKVPKAIADTLKDDPESFSTLNRGLTVVAGGLEYNNQTKAVTLKFIDREYHGVLDGGHTLQAIINHRSDLAGEPQEGHCNIEIFTGLPESEIPRVVEARNTSKQVQSKSLMNLAGSFAGLQSALGDLAAHISWKENDDGDMDVREVIAILTALDPSFRAEGAQPVVAYSGKEACLRRFNSNPMAYEKLYGIAGDALSMWDAIQYWLPSQYNVLGPEPGVSGKYGRLTGIKWTPKRPRELPFIGKSTVYNTPTGYIYPVLGAFGAMLEEMDGKWVWGLGINPMTLIQEGAAAEIFSVSVRTSIDNFRNPNRTGKDTQAWNLAYQKAQLMHQDAQLKYQRDLIENLKREAPEGG